MTWTLFSTSENKTTYVAKIGSEYFYIHWWHDGDIWVARDEIFRVFVQGEQGRKWVSEHNPELLMEMML